MRACDFTLELSDGTLIKVSSLPNAKHPDVRAFHFPPGVLIPFSQKNLPKQIQDDHRETVADGC